MDSRHLDPATGQPGYRLEELPDGTVRQVSALTGTVVWTAPGRSHRLHGSLVTPRPLRPDDRELRCAFCPGRYLETPPERARLVLDPGSAAGEPWQILRHVPADQLGSTVAVARRIPNLFQILPFEYWQANHGHEIPEDLRARVRDYAATPVGRAHLLGIMRTRASAAGAPPEQVAAMPEEELLERAARLMAGSHDVVVARRHFVDGASHDDQLASAGDLTADEHHAFIALVVDGLRELTASTPSAVYVSAFQNWLAAAGATFDHLHTQLVTIDEYGPMMTGVISALRSTPDLFTVAITDPAARDRLVIAENDHAIALAGVGHRYPTVEIYSTSAANRPWEHPEAALRGVSDMLHACHAATGRMVPTNEEWHYRPVGVDVAMPWRIDLKWRITTAGGFEGATRINVSTVAPGALREQIVSSLRRARDAGRIAGMALGDECSHRRGALAYLGA